MSGRWHDPSCGEGNIPKCLLARGIQCTGSELRDRGYGTVNTDFFSLTRLRANHIITNPPFADVEAYARHALTLVQGKVILLARLAILEGIKRRAFLETSGLSHVWVSSKRVSMPPGGMGIKARNGTIPFAWFVFRRPGHVGPATIGWV